MIKSIILKEKEVEALVNAQKLMGSCASASHQRDAEVIGDILARWEKNKAVDFKRKKKDEKRKLKRNNCTYCKHVCLCSSGGKLVSTCKNLPENADPKKFICKEFTPAFKTEL